MTSPYETLSSRIAYENRWTRVREDMIRLPDGSASIYGVVERSDFVIVVPWHHGRLTLVEQYRYPVQARVWEFPMGMWEPQTGVDVASQAEIELREETGLVANSMVFMGTIMQGPGYCSQRGHVFLATELTQGPTQRELTELDMVTRDVSIPEFESLVRDGTVAEAMSLSTFALLRVKQVF
jgi:8-oxo-dGTP pyrophosphatase MutT (NUDIX family)